jgi:hypothetical protein
MFSNGWANALSDKPLQTAEFTNESNTIKRSTPHGKTYPIPYGTKLPVSKAMRKNMPVANFPYVGRLAVWSPNRLKWKRRHACLQNIPCELIQASPIELRIDENCTGYNLQGLDKLGNPSTSLGSSSPAWKYEIMYNNIYAIY